MEDFKKFSLYKPTKAKYSDTTTETQSGDGQTSIKDTANKFMVESLRRQAENAMLLAKVEQLQSENARLEAENATLLAGIEQLQTESKRLKAESGTRLTKAELDCWHERYAICPWCGYEDHDSWEYQEGKTDAECPNCGKPITVTVKSEDENQQLQELVNDLWLYINTPVDKDHDTQARLTYADLAKRVHEFGSEAYK